MHSSSQQPPASRILFVGPAVRECETIPCHKTWNGECNYSLSSGGHGLSDGMYKNQLQELAQRSCFNLPSYACIREGPDHAQQFKATVNFNSEIFESPVFFSTLRQAENAAAKVALSTVSKRGPSKILAAQVLDERGVYKNLLQETAHRAGLNLPVYTVVRSGPVHVPVFSCTVELAGMMFTGLPGKVKKQAEKNAAMAAWSSLKQMSQSGSSSSSSSSSASSGCHEEQDKVIVARFLSSLNPPESSNSPQSNQHNISPTTYRNSFPSTTTSFIPNWAIHYMWMQEHAAQQQRQHMAIPIGFPPPNPLFPWMHPNHHQPYSFTEPSNMNTVTIREIEEEAPAEASLLTDEKLEKPDSFSSTHEAQIENGPGKQKPVRILSPRTNIRPRIPRNGPRMQVGGSKAPFMAQPVQIRSVVPVFSARPKTNPGHESALSDETRSVTPCEISIMSKMRNLRV